MRGAWGLLGLLCTLVVSASSQLITTTTESEFDDVTTTTDLPITTIIPETTTDFILTTTINDKISHISRINKDPPVIIAREISDPQEEDTFNLPSNASAGVYWDLYASERANNSVDQVETEHPKNVSSDSRGAGRLLSLLASHFLPSLSTNASSPLCREQSELFQKELSRFALWAVQMFDASSKLPNGVLAGATAQLGNFDECLGIHVALDHYQRPIQGQYCLAKLEIIDAEDINIQDHRSAWPIIKEPHNSRLVARDVIHWAVCLPSACSAQDLQLALEESSLNLFKTFGVQLDAQVPENMCQVSSPRRLQAGDFVMGAIIVFFVMIVVAATLVDFLNVELQRKIEGVFGKALHCFSARKNLILLIRVDSKREVVSLHVLRFFSMFIILMGHHFINASGSPYFNNFFEEGGRNPLIAFVMVAPVFTVDTFFFVSGFLTGRSMIKDIANKRFRFFNSLLHRIIRLTPVYMLVVGFHATLLDLLGSGPMWKARAIREKLRCANNWWTNLLYINNYINTPDLCMFQSWHLACDLHFFILTPIVILALYYRPRIGFIIAGVLSVGSATALFFTTLFYNLDPNLMSHTNVLNNLNADPTFRLTYIPSHTRAIPYIIGAVAAWFVHQQDTAPEKILLPRMRIYFGWGLAAVFMCGPMFSLVPFYQPEWHLPQWTSAVYAAIHRFPWSLALCWVVFVASTRNAGISIQHVLDWGLIVPLSRLSYSVFIIHSVVQLYTTGSIRSPEYMDIGRVTWVVFGEVGLAYVAALILHLIFEAPIQQIDKNYLSKSRKLDSSITSSIENIVPPKEPELPSIEKPNKLALGVVNHGFVNDMNLAKQTKIEYYDPAARLRA